MITSIRTCDDRRVGPVASISGRAATATSEEYFAGRSDRLGVDAVLDASSITRSRIRAARPAPPGCDVRALVALLRHERPSWLWIDGTTSADPVHLALLTRLGERVGAVVVLLVEEDDE